ncbi:MAG: septal ring lytic transglycosylase RlpA family protein [Methylacidiphilales bacterium]|nr:septal ring lytic transglycosylase RlpA family protein [Candidatus Methylacidiphilales bacterium]
MSEIVSLGLGKMSIFGGPADEGVGPHEGLALIGPTDLGIWWFSCLFLPEQPAGTTGLARRLNPRAFYLAMRWDYTRWPKDLLRHTVVKLTNPANGLWVLARPVDFGPGDGSVIDGQPTKDTGRIADLSPGAANALGLCTDDKVGCELLK